MTRTKTYAVLFASDSDIVIWLPSEVRCDILKMLRQMEFFEPTLIVPVKSNDFVEGLELFQEVGQIVQNARNVGLEFTTHFSGKQSKVLIPLLVDFSYFFEGLSDNGNGYFDVITDIKVADFQLSHFFNDGHLDLHGKFPGSFEMFENKVYGIIGNILNNIDKSSSGHTSLLSKSGPVSGAKIMCYRNHIQL